MGSQLLKNYNVEKDSFLTAGYNNYWKVYKGSHKERKMDVSVFVFEKKNLEKYSNKEEIMNVLRKEAQTLAKYKHPNILSLVEPLLEDKQSIIFVTEPISYSVTSWIESTSPSKLEIKVLITEICNSILFLHDDAKVVHLSVNPDCIFLNDKTQIKLSGFNFSITDPSSNIIDFKLSNLTPNALPVLKYTAPEVVLDNKCGYSSDVFSIGALIYNLLRIHKGDTERDLIGMSNNEVHSYKSCFENVSIRLQRMNFENDDHLVINKVCERNPENRPRIKEILEYSWFNDPKLKALRFVENLEANDMSKNIEFLSTFSLIIGHFENKIIEKRFLPAFLNSMKNETLIVPLLPSIFSICEGKYKIDFESQVWPTLKTLFHMKQIPAQALYFILSKICVISEKVSNSEFVSNMLNIICKALDCGVGKIQAVVLDNLTFIIKKVDSLAFKNQIFPRLVSIVLNTTSQKIKIDILKSFTNVYSLLDQNIINESLLNTLEKVRKSDNTSEVCISVVGVYEEIAKVVSVESIANKILPNLIAILVTGNISKKNFENIMNLVQKYLSRIKDSREKDLTDDVVKSEVSTEVKTPTTTKVTTSSNDDFLSAFFGDAKKTQTKEPTINENDFDFISKGIEESQKKTEKPKSIFDGVGTSTANNNNNLENLLNSGKTPSFITKPQRNTNKTIEINFDKPRDTSPLGLTSKKNEQDIFNNFGKMNNTKQADNDILNNLLNDLGNNPVPNTNNNKTVNNMYNMKPMNNNPNPYGNNNNLIGLTNNNNTNFMRNIDSNNLDFDLTSLQNKGNVNMNFTGNNMNNEFNMDFLKNTGAPKQNSFSNNNNAMFGNNNFQVNNNNNNDDLFANLYNQNQKNPNNQNVFNQQNKNVQQNKMNNNIGNNQNNKQQINLDEFLKF